MQLLVDALGQGAADPLDASQILDTRSQHPLKSTEVLEEPLAPARPDRGNFFQARGGARLAAARAVPGDREAVRLVADLLDQVQRGMVGREPPRRLFSNDEELRQPGLASGRPPGRTG